MITDATLETAVEAIDHELSQWEMDGADTITYYREINNDNLKKLITAELRKVDAYLERTFPTVGNLYDHLSSGDTSLSHDLIVDLDVDPEDYSGDPVALLMDVMGDKFQYAIALDLQGAGRGLWEIMPNNNYPCLHVFV